MMQDDIIKAIQAAFEEGSVEVTRHFWDELRADDFVHADVRCAIDTAERVVDMGIDRAGNPKYEVTGSSADARIVSLIGSFKPTGAVLFITAYEGVQE
jgi:hypothetical protein